MSATKEGILKKMHSLCFTSFVQLTMKESAYDLASIATDHISFLRLRNLAILDSANSLIYLKLSQSQDITEEQKLFEKVLLSFDFY